MNEDMDYFQNKQLLTLLLELRSVVKSEENQHKVKGCKSNSSLKT